jgi:hypothetical protein
MLIIFTLIIFTLILVTLIIFTLIILTLIIFTLIIFTLIILTLIIFTLIIFFSTSPDICSEECHCAHTNRNKCEVYYQITLPFRHDMKLHQFVQTFILVNRYKESEKNTFLVKSSKNTGKFCFAGKLSTIHEGRRWVQCLESTIKGW